MVEINQANDTVDPHSVNADCCCLHFRKITRAITQMYDKYLESTNIRITQFTLLVALASTRAKTLTEIAESLVMDRTTLTRNLKPLEKLELITKVATTDKRTKAYTLTEKGRDTLRLALPLWQQAQRKVKDTFGDSRYQNVASELDKLLMVVSVK